MRKTFSIIGCGNVGKTLGRLWTLHGVFELRDILNRTSGSAQRAAAFVGAGRAIAAYSELRSADIYLIATPDGQIAPSCAELARTGLLSGDSIVFHCSGALSSGELEPARHLGAATASVHPVRSFAVPKQLVQEFTETRCGAEGDARALEILEPGFSAIGAQLVPIRADAKILYHAAAVFACNYLTTLLDVAGNAYMQAGIPQDMALQMVEPLVRETVNNVFRLGPAEALTGPIARGDMATVEKQQRAVSAWDKDYGHLYEQFARLTIELAALRGPPKA